MALSTAQRTLWEIAAGALVLVAGLLYVRHDIAQHAILDFKLHATDSTAKVLTAKADTLAVQASGAAQEAEKVKAKAKVLVAQAKAAQIKLDSTMRASADERTAATVLLRDSLAQASALRAEVSRLIEVSRRDSSASTNARTVGATTIAALLATVQADSVALLAEQQHSASLQALNTSLNTEVKLLHAQQPSKAGEWIVRGLTLAGGIFIGQHVH